MSKWICVDDVYSADINSKQRFHLNIDNFLDEGVPSECDEERRLQEARASKLKYIIGR